MNMIYKKTSKLPLVSIKYFSSNLPPSRKYDAYILRKHNNLFSIPEHLKNDKRILRLICAFCWYISTDYVRQYRINKYLHLDRILALSHPDYLSLDGKEISSDFYNGLRMFTLTVPITVIATIVIKPLMGSYLAAFFICYPVVFILYGPTLIYYSCDRLEQNYIKRGLDKKYDTFELSLTEVLKQLDEKGVKLKN